MHILGLFLDYRRHLYLYTHIHLRTPIHLYTHMNTCIYTYIYTHILPSHITGADAVEKAKKKKQALWNLPADRDADPTDTGKGGGDGVEKGSEKKKKSGFF